MRTTRNITVAVSRESYRKARRWAVEQDVSLSAAVAFIIEYLERLQAIVDRLQQREQEAAANNAENKIGCETVKKSVKRKAKRT